MTNEEILFKAVDNKDVAGIKLVLSKGVSKINARNSRGMTALLDVARSRNFKGRTECIRMLIEAGADPTITSVGSWNYNADSVGYIVNYSSNISVLNILLDHGLDPNYLPYTGWANNVPLLHHIVKRGDQVNYTKIIDRLVSMGADAHVKDSNGNNALHIAASHSQPETVKKLINIGLDINARNNKGKTPLGLVFGTNNKVDSAIELIRAGADYIDSATKASELPLKKIKPILAWELSTLGLIPHAREEIYEKVLKKVKADWRYIRYLSSPPPEMLMVVNIISNGQAAKYIKN